MPRGCRATEGLGRGPRGRRGKGGDQPAGLACTALGARELLLFLFAAADRQERIKNRVALRALILVEGHGLHPPHGSHTAGRYRTTSTDCDACPRAPASRAWYTPAATRRPASSRPSQSTSRWPYRNCNRRARRLPRPNPRAAPAPRPAGSRGRRPDYPSRRHRFRPGRWRGRPRRRRVIVVTRCAAAAEETGRCPRLIECPQLPWTPLRTAFPDGSIGVSRGCEERPLEFDATHLHVWRGPGWQCGQMCVPRWPTSSRSIGAPHAGQGSPVRP